MCTLKKKGKTVGDPNVGELCGFGAFFFFFAPYWKKNRYFLSKLCTQQQTRVWEHVSLIFSNFMPSQENSPNGIFPIICGFSPIRCMDPSLKKRILVKYVGRCLENTYSILELLTLMVSKPFINIKLIATLKRCLVVKPEKNYNQNCNLST